MQIIALGLWQAVCLAIVAGCVYAYLLHIAGRADDCGPIAPDLEEVFQQSPLGFHVPSETRA